MIIRKMEEKDLEAVSAICLASFLQSVADSLSDEGVSTFSTIAASHSFGERMKGDNLMLVAESDGKTVGVIELKQGRHVAMLFVSPDYQKKGVGKKLLAAALEHARTDIVTVSASLSSVPAYEKYGFECKGATGESEGLIYQPMEIELNSSMHAK
ncbi:GNAT family N-acetyltransferase [Idiomarina sp. M1R2S28]|uniref:GNAT family N-acetyltransferase n=1 Tax=Idiomarina rhizosphaerae TaxID=2961572 RepID=A0A9X2FWJ9_9GAMM|nr:GNAT family N-acetyltransferase [Idiomarina rhizosphaerae]